MIHRRQLIAIRAGTLPHLALGSREPSMPLATRHRFRTRWTRGSAAVSAVEAYSVRATARDHPLVVHIANHASVHIIHRAVVVERSVIPIPARVSHARVAEAVVDAAIESDMRTPIAFMPQVNAVAPTPISRSPKCASERRQNPRAGHPIIAGVAIGPITRLPDVSRGGADGLRVHRQDGWRNRDRQENASERCGRQRHDHREKYHHFSRTQHNVPAPVDETRSNTRTLQLHRRPFRLMYFRRAK